MPNALQRDVTAYKAIEAAWYEILDNAKPKSRNTVGSDGLSINDFNQDKKANLNSAQRAARKPSYEFSALKPYLIPKADGKKYRVICVPTVRDRIIQRSLLNYLEKQYGKKLANDISYGFVRGRTVPDAVKKACALRQSHPWAFKTDITSFFDRLDRDILMVAVKKLVREKSLLTLLESAVQCEIETAGRSTRNRIKAMGIEHGKGVRQGMPLSPFFANVYLHQFDKWLETEKIPAVRYADDLIFFLDSEEACTELAERCAKKLKKLELDIPGFGEKSKSVIYRPEEAAEFLGLGLNRKTKGYALEIMPGQIDAIKTTLGQFASVKEMNSRGVTLASLGQRLNSMMNGYLAAYDCCSNLEDLEKSMGSVSKDALRKLYQKDLGIDLSKLNAHARTFLML